MAPSTRQVRTLDMQLESHEKDEEGHWVLSHNWDNDLFATIPVQKLYY